MVKVYLETTVFNYYFLDDPKRAHEKKITVFLFNEIGEGKFTGFVSDMTIAELNHCYEPLRTKMLELISKFKIKPLEISESLKKHIEKLADTYIRLEIIPKEKRPDAIHVATATLFQLNFLVSWNCKHIVRPELEEKINAANALNDYGKIALCTPMEVIHYEE